MSDDLLTQARIAREFSVSKARVSQAVKEGKLIPAGQTGTGKPLFSREDAASVFSLSFLNNRNINHAQTGDEIAEQKKVKLPEKVKSTNAINKKVKDEADPVQSITENVDLWLQELLGSDFSRLADAGKIARSRAVREARMAALADIEVRKAQGELIEREIIALEAVSIGAEITAIMHNWPARLSPELSVMTDQHEIKQFLIDEVNKLIDHLDRKLSEV